jgi:serine/threonine protein kinase/sugar lactone lactonase YvrE
MSNDPSSQEHAAPNPPVSVFSGPIAELVGHRLLSPPSRPGLLATLARYEVIRVLGGGGMGVVLLARDSENGRDVALKMVRPELVPNQQMVHRFVKEAGHLQKLKHPNVMPVLEVSDRAQGPYFVMPFFQRGSLAQRIKPGQPLDAADALDIALQVAEGLKFAHQRGIIHRDLKPANILLGEAGQACLADFGLARTMFNDSIVDVERDQFEGTAPYLSPGVAAGNAEDTRCDIYAFGALLYEMLTGEPPYAGRDSRDIRQQILAGPPKPIRSRQPQADPALTAVAQGAMARQLRERYADMADVVADLQRIKQGKTPLGPHGLARRVRHVSPLVWILAGAAMFALALWALWPSAPAKAPPVLGVPAPSNPPLLIVQKPPVTKPAVPVVPPASSPPLIVGAIGQLGVADGIGALARFSSPGGIAVDSAGNIYVADTGNNTIRKISPAGEVRTLAGLAGQSGQIDDIGATARFRAPLGIAVDAAGNLFVSEFANNTIRKITPQGSVSTLAGSAANPGWRDSLGDNAHFRNPWALAVDQSDNVYVADKDNFVIRKITPDGRVSTFAGQPGQPGFADGPGPNARFKDPRGVALDGAGNLYVADTANNALRRITSAGVVSTVTLDLSFPDSVAADASGAVYVTDSAGLHRISNGRVETLPPLALTSDPAGPFATAGAIALDARGALYLSDTVKDIICWRPARPLAN